MADPFRKKLVAINALQNIRGVDLPVGLTFVQLLVTGPPGAGKSFYIKKIRGWPNEGYIDLTSKGWWKDKTLIYRPREVHLGLPFEGFPQALTVFEPEWKDAEKTSASATGTYSAPAGRVRFSPEQLAATVYFRVSSPQAGCDFQTAPGTQVGRLFSGGRDHEP